jgi:hypothetical protein
MNPTKNFILAPFSQNCPLNINQFLAGYRRQTQESNLLPVEKQKKGAMGTDARNLSARKEIPWRSQVDIYVNNSGFPSS